jgi:hypothetical protein
MANLRQIVKQIIKERNRLEKQLSGLNAALTAFAGVYRGTKRISKPGRKRHVSAKSRAKMAAAQKRRWAKVRAKQGA